MSADNLRPPAAPRNALAALIVLTLFPGAAPAQFPGPFPERAGSERVEKVRQALQGFFGPDAKGAQEELDKQLKALRGVADLGQALVLPEWGGGRPQIGDFPGPKGRDQVAGRFEKALADVLAGGDPARQSAAATLFAELSAADHRQGFRGPESDPLVPAVLTRLLPKVGALADSEDAAVREAAARALGRTALDPDQVVAALDKLLGDKQAAVRRAAAEALVRQARGDDVRPGEVGVPGRPVEVTLSACVAVVPAAAKRVNDEDDEVSRHCAEAIRQAAKGMDRAAQGLQQQLGPRLPPMPAKPGPPPPAGGAFPGAGGPPGQGWQGFAPAAGALGQGVPSLRPLLKSESAARRVQACQALEAVGAARTRMLAVAGDGAALAKILGGKEDPLLAGLKEVLPDLAACAGHNDIEVRLAALYALEELGPEAAPAAGAAAKALADNDPFVRWAGARVLGKMAPAEAKTAVPALAGRVADENGDVRITALAALERYGPAAAPEVGRVSQLLKRGDEATRPWDEATRLWAVRVLVAAGPDGRKEATGPLIGALSAKETAVRRAAVGALARYGKPDDATTAALRAALKDDDAEVRRTASEALLAE